ncbi:MAG: DUF2183 domain-containing protein [Pirellulaceae bacterium]|nr:DUF2183 domain-containing protein [Pirellulaceae bacterium]
MKSNSFINRVLQIAERGWDRLATALLGKRRGEWIIGIQTYRTYGTAEFLQFSGRVLRDPERAKSTIHDSFWKNITAAFHQWESDEVPTSRLSVTDGEHTVQCISDEEGYTQTRIDLDRERNSGWHTLHATLDEIPYGRASQERYPCDCLIPQDHARFGVISDIDDTVLHSQVTSRWRMFLWSLTHNAYTRLPLPGVARLYRDLSRVNGVPDVNPVFYVSSSPWNLYSMLIEFLEAVDLPRGPVLLRDLGVGGNASLGGDHSHKGDKIESILRTYPEMKFILLGDSGQHDAQIYSQVALKFPGRILAIYIRNVGSQDEEMLGQAHEVCDAADTPFVLISDSSEISAHAKRHGWIEPPGEVPGVKKSTDPMKVTV